MLKRALKLFLRGLALFVATLIITLVVVWVWPTLILNGSRALPLANYFLRPATLSGTPRVFKIISTGVLSKHIEIDFAELCYEANAGQRACFSKLAFVADLTLFGDPTWIAIKNFEASEGDIQWTVLPSPTEDKIQSKHSDQLLREVPHFLAKVQLDKLRIDLKSLTLTTSIGSLSTAADLTANGIMPPIEWNLKTQGEFRSESTYRWNGSLSARSTKSLWYGPFVLKSELAASLPERGSTSLDIKADLKPEQVIFSMATNARLGKKRVKGAVKGEVTTKSAKLSIDGRASEIIPELPSIGVSQCELQMDKKSAAQIQYHVDCPTVLTGAICRFSGGICEEVFKNTNATIRSDINIVGQSADKQEVTGSVTLEIAPLFKKIKEGKATVEVDVGGKLRNFPDELILRSKADIKITSFGKIVQLFRQRPWSIPAPFNTLDGAIHFSAQADGNFLKEGGTIPVKLTTDLASQNQALRVLGNGKLLLKQEDKSGPMKSHLDLDVVLNDVKLALPPLEANAPPRAFPDSRIREKADAIKPTTPASSSFTYEVRIATAAQPVQIISNLAKATIPITVSVNSSSRQGTTGSIRVSSFPVELFRRKATIEHLYLSLKKDPRYNEINGKVSVKHTDYTVYILLLGLAEKPEIKFQSEPPLPEAEVLSVLIFGKKPEKLTSDEASSVGNTRAAVQDNALNLASMYLLASTPVESVGYDPLTKSFHAKIRLRDGTSVTVGSDFKDINQLGLRQRLGSNWSIATYVTDPFSVVNRTLTALLEWSVGY